ncbi:uncharacterized protein V3H82_014451 isoform 2-T2 [Fundulus diaphanus]
MFYCSSGGSDPLNMSKSGILRGIITEKLSTAAREILAVVERTVADYEEEASGFRREIERQRRQLGLLQPRVKLPRTDLQSHEEVVVGEEQEEQQLTQSTGVEAAESHSPPGKHSEEEEEDDEGEDAIEEDGDDEEVEQEDDHYDDDDEESLIINKMIKEDLKDPDFEIPSRSVQRGHKRRRLTLRMNTKEPLNLRIRILEDSETTVLSNSVFQKSPIWDLGCPHGLEEAAFLDLLRSTFPQLAAGEPFATFITDKSRKLQPLNVKALTPEEIYTAIKSIGNSALYIRPKKDEVKTKKKEEHLVADSTTIDPGITDNETGLPTRSVQLGHKRHRLTLKMNTKEPLNLRIRILEDSETTVLSNSVFKKSPIWDLGCPHGLEEAAFLDLLRSTFPQLAAGEPFDTFITDKSRKLQPLNVKALTPEEIYTAIKSIGNSALYIRPKKEEVKAKKKEEHLVADSTTIDPGIMDNETGLPTRSVQRGHKRHRLTLKMNTKEPLNLRIRILEDSETTVLSNSVFQKSPIWDLGCPHGLEEAAFLDLLRSTFPQLAAGEPFDTFITDKSRKLQPLNVKALTPEEIYTAIKSIGNSALYIRPKKDEVKAKEKEEHPVADSTTIDPGIMDNETGLLIRSVQLGHKRHRLTLKMNTKEPLNLRIRILEDSETTVLSNSVFKKYPIWDLGCPHGLEEAAFLDLLRSTFPQLAAGEPFDTFITDKSRKLQPLNVKALTPEEIYTAIKSIGNSALYIRPKKEEVKTKKKEEHLVADSTTIDNETGLPTSSVQSAQGSGKSKVSSESKSKQDNLQDEDEEADGNTDSSSTRDQTSEGDKTMKPDPKLQRRKRTRKGQGKQGRKRNGETKMYCKVCGVWYQNYGCLMNHALSHVSDPQSVCGVCGEKFESVEELKEHLKSHKNIHNCSHCGKSFVSIIRFNNHVAKHTGEGLFECDICSKTFSSKGSLNYHHWVHVEDKPHKCDICQQTFGLESHLKVHMKQHERKEVYKCKICNKSVTSRRSLAWHMLTHSDQRYYGCETCGKRFKLKSGLKSHERTHTVRERPFLCHICCKTFPSEQGLMCHLKVHSTEKPFVCTICSKAFKYKTSLSVHMKVHTEETPFECCECGRRFKRKNKLVEHMEIHSGIKDFICSICGKACLKREYLRVHMRTHTGERPFQCSLCDKAFTQSHCLKTHMKTHQDQENASLTLSEPGMI